MSLLNRYYLYGLVPLFITCFILFLVSSSFEVALFFAIGFIWPYSFSTPGLREKLEDKEYRLSFLRLIYRYQYFLEKRLPQPKALAQTLAPFLASSLLLFLHLSLFPLYVLAGSLFYELWRKQISNKLLS